MDIFSLIAEERIRAAQAQGAFDDLPGRGRPLPPDDDAKNVPDDLRMAYRVLKNSGFAPPEVVERKEVETLLDLLEGGCPEREKVRGLRRLEALVFALERRGRSVRLSAHDDYLAGIIARMEAVRRSGP